MARSREEIISDMVDAGMSDDEIRSAFKSSSSVSNEQEQPQRGFLDTVNTAAGRITDSIPAVASLMSPTLGMAQYAGQQINNASGEVGGAVAERLGAKGMNPYGAAALGMASSIAVNPMTYIDPGSGFSGKVLKPTAPIERQAAVSAAERIGMPMRRGEVTGGKLSTGLSNFMEKTVMGSGPEDAFTARQYKALNAEKSRIQSDIGNPGDVYSVGQKAQSNILSRSSKMKATKDTMFESIPENVTVPLKNVKQTADILMDEQSRLYGGTQSPEVLRWSRIVQDAELSSGKGVTGGPEYTGVTRQLPSGEPEYGIKASVSPEDQFAPKSNYFALKRLRENLNGAIEQAKKASNQSDYRDLTRLKSSLDKDINDFASGGVSPLDNMMSKEFKETYRKANAFSGAYKNLFKSDEAQTLLQAPPEKVVDIVFKKNNETAIKQFRALSGEEGFLPAKQKFTQDLLDSNNLTAELNKYEPGTLRAIYNAQELKELQDYGLAQGIPKTTSQLQGTQGSARSNISAGQYTGLGAGILSLLTGNVVGAGVGIGQFLAPGVISRANLSMAGGIPASLGRSSLQAIKVGAESGVPRDQIYRKFIERITKKEGGQ